MNAFIQRNRCRANGVPARQSFLGGLVPRSHSEGFTPKVHSEGFTILELIAAMGVLVLMVAVLTAAFNQASRAWTTSENRVDTFQTGRAILDLMTRDLSQAFASGRPVAWFDGHSTNQMTFVTAIGGGTGTNTDLSEVEYLFTPGSGSGPGYQVSSLVRYYYYGWGDPLNPPPSPLTSFTDLADAGTVLNCSFTYYNSSFTSNTTYSSAINNLPPAAVQIFLDLLDAKSAGTYSNLVKAGNTPAANNVYSNNVRHFSTIVYIPGGVQ